MHRSLAARRHARRAIAAALLAWGGTTAVDATTLAIIRTPTEIVLAADSLMTLYGARPQQTCKIRRHGDVVFAVAGLVESSEGVLDAHRIVTQVLMRNVAWSEHIHTIEQRLQEPLLRTLRRMEREHPDQFRAQLERGFALHLSLGAFRHGVALLEIREFFVELDPAGAPALRVHRVSCPRDCPGATSVFGVGETDAMMQRVSGLRQYPADLAALARDLVDLQVRATPEFVGPPIDVVRLSRRGIEWTSRKPSCPG